MIVDNLNIMGVSIFPPEANAPLVIHANAILAGTLSLQFLEPVPGWHSQVVQRIGGVQGHELSQHDSEQIRGKTPHWLAVEQALSILIREALDHTVTITARVTNVKRYYVSS